MNTMKNWYKAAIAEISGDIGDINPNLVPVYCMDCKKHIRGVKAGYDNPATSHAYCEECYKKAIAMLENSVPITQQK